MADDLLIGQGLVVAYGRSHVTPVLHGVDIRIRRGETVGIVGESGSGKTTLGRALLGLVQPVAGSQPSAVHGFPSLQLTGVPEQVPPEHTSPVVHRFPSLHAAVLFVW